MLSSGDSLLWVVKGVRGVYCEFSWLALEPAVRTRILDSGEASSKFWVDQPGSRAALIFFAESKQSSCHDDKTNVLAIVFLNFGFVLFRTCSASAQPGSVRVVESTHDWRGVFLSQRSPVFSRVSSVYILIV